MKPTLRVSQKDLASWLTTNVRWVRELTTRGILTQDASGYDLKPSIQAYLTFLRSKTGSVTDERARLLKAQAEMAELKVRQRQGELVTKESVQKGAFAMHRRARDQFQNLPARYSGLFAAESNQEKIFQMLTKAIYDILVELSDGPSKKD